MFAFQFFVYFHQTMYYIFCVCIALVNIWFVLFLSRLLDLPYFLWYFLFLAAILKPMVLNHYLRSLCVCVFVKDWKTFAMRFVCMVKNSPLYHYSKKKKRQRDFFLNNSQYILFDDGWFHRRSIQNENPRCGYVWVCVNLLRINAMDIKENIPYICSKCEWDLK